MRNDQARILLLEKQAVGGRRRAASYRAVHVLLRRQDGQVAAAVQERVALKRLGAAKGPAGATAALVLNLTNKIVSHNLVPSKVIFKIINVQFLFWGFKEFLCLSQCHGKAIRTVGKLSRGTNLCQI